MSADMLPLITKALGETVYMVVVSMIISSILGIPLGVLLHTTSKGQILECLPINRVVGAIVNAIRSIPFIILMVAIIPLTRLIVGSAIGTTAAMVPLVLASVPFIGRQVETSLREIPYGIVEMGVNGRIESMKEKPCASNAVRWSARSCRLKLLSPAGTS